MKVHFSLLFKQFVICLGIVCSLAIAGCGNRAPSTAADYKAAAMGANLTPAEKANYDQQAAKALAGQASEMSSNKQGPPTSPSAAP